MRLPVYRVKGVKIVRTRKAGRTYEYHYHRATKERIRAQPGTAAYAVEVDRLDRIAAKRTPDDLGAMMDAFASPATPEWARLSAYTKRDYTRCMTYLAPMRGTDPRAISPKHALAIRDKAHEAHGYRFGGMVVQFCRRLWNWGIPRELVDRNPWDRIELPKRDKSRGVANPAWTARELTLALLAAPPGLARGLALCAMGRDANDAIRTRWSDLEAGSQDRGKTGARGALSVPEALSAIFEGERPSEYVATTQAGKPWKTANSFTKARRELIQALAKEGEVRSGLTTHGLRKTLAVIASNAGADLRAVQAALTHKTLAMSLHYAAEADMTKRTREAMNALSSALSDAGLGKNAMAETQAVLTSSKGKT